MDDLHPAPVDRVELFEDRASVSRTVRVPAAGRHHLRIGPLTPLTQESTLAFLPSPSILVEEAEVHRQALTRAQADPDHVDRLRQREDALTSRLAALAGEVALAEDTGHTADAVTHEAWQRAPTALTTGTAWLDGLRRLEDGRVAAALSLVRTARQVPVLEAERQRARGMLDAARAGVATHRAWLELTVLAEGPGEIQVRSTIPCALWRPVHRAWLRDGRVRWEVGGMCWNATGEDWSDVELVCSTARPSGPSDPPALTDDYVHTQPKNRETVVEAREEHIQVAREGARATASEVLGVDDGGEPRVYTCPTRVSLPSTGAPVQVHLEEWEAAATVSWVAWPEASAQAILQTLQPNTGSRPLLAGPVDLLRDHGVVGRGRVGLVPSGEPFRLGWGSHDGVRISRKHQVTRERARLTGRVTLTFSVELRVVHLGDEPLEIEVRERIPVSELKQVRVSDPEATPALTSIDDDGVCCWALRLAPGDRRELALSYEVDANASVQLPW